MSKTECYINDIKCLSFQAEENSKNITILLYHGWGSSVYHQQFFGTVLSKFGYNVLIPQIMYHDSREPLEDHFSKQTMDNYFWRTILHTTEEAKPLIDEITAKKQKVVVIGSSMGGFIASAVFMEQTVDALININGSGAWFTSEEMFQKDGFAPSPNLNELKERDPIQSLHRIQNRPILLLHGQHDTVVSLVGQQTFYEEALKAENTSNISLIMYPNVNHSTTLSMVEEIINWLEKHLNKNRC